MDFPLAILTFQKKGKKKEKERIMMRKTANNRKKKEKESVALGGLQDICDFRLFLFLIRDVLH